MGWGGSEFVLAESQTRLYPHMRAQFGRDPTAVSKKVPFNIISRFANMPGQSNASTYCDVRSSNEFKHPFGIKIGNGLMQYLFGEQIFIFIASPKLECLK